VPRTLIVWFREDLRLHDNPALAHAVAHAARVIPVYLHTPQQAGDWPAGAASRWWLHHSLQRLEQCLRKAGAGLVIRRGATSLVLLQALARECAADGVVWNRLYTPGAGTRDARIEAALAAGGTRVWTFHTGLLFEPAAIHRSNGAPYRVFTAFWKRCLARLQYQPTSAEPGRIPGAGLPAGLTVEQLGLLPRSRWDRGLAARWTPGEAGACARADAFFDAGVADYVWQRDLPAVPGTSRLSPHLHFGELSPRVLMNRALQQREAAAGPQARDSVTRFMAELGWREFAAHLLFHFPASSDTALDPRFERFPWAADAGELLACWQHGRTGFPIIDAGMRELWHTGWMHNRVRMLAGSFLVKNLLLHWLHGARWFWDTLVDADLASNSLGWQWVAGCGADAAPYFRVFNPVLQGRRFDPQGEYVRRWVPELRGLEARYVHTPWRAGGSVDYPPPLVDLQQSRERALAAFRSLRG
jgi:deoxyribodipyrimidine photo-lyase